MMNHVRVVYGTTERMPAEYLRGLILSLRPYQWSKNLLLFSGLIFSGSLMKTDAVTASLAGFISFCMASSALYLLNDIQDLERDRQHPEKRHRPMAAGVIGPKAGAVAMGSLLAGSFLMAGQLGVPFLVVVAAYVAMNVCYSFGLKNVVLLDVMLIALGFVLRAVAGALVVGVQPSDWLILCTLSLALMLAFGKRRHEIGLLLGEAENHRPTLSAYSIPFLDTLLAMLAAIVIMTYSLYAVSEHTMVLFGSTKLIFTVPMVFYGIFRYLYLLCRKGEGGDPTRMLLADGPSFWNVLLWGVTVCIVIYSH